MKLTFFVFSDEHSHECISFVCRFGVFCLFGWLVGLLVLFVHLRPYGSILTR